MKNSLHITEMMTFLKNMLLDKSRTTALLSCSLNLSMRCFSARIIQSVNNTDEKSLASIPQVIFTMNKSYVVFSKFIYIYLFCRMKNLISYIKLLNLNVVVMIQQYCVVILILLQWQQTNWEFKLENGTYISYLLPIFYSLMHVNLF